MIADWCERAQHTRGSIISEQEGLDCLGKPAESKLESEPVSRISSTVSVSLPASFHTLCDRRCPENIKKN